MAAVIFLSPQSNGVRNILEGMLKKGVAFGGFGALQYLHKLLTILPDDDHVGQTAAGPYGFTLTKFPVGVGRFP
jgi:hypothetical protein